MLNNSRENGPISKGNYEKFIGKVQERYAGKKVELMKWADAWHEKPTPKAVEKKPR